MRALLVSLIVLSILAGCSSQKKEKPVSPYRPAEGGKVYGGQYVFNETSDLPTLDPVQIGDVSSHHTAHQIYELLVDLDPNTLEVVPELAKRWEISDDELTYTFILRDSIFFHNSPCFPQKTGRKVIAQDIKYSFERVCNPNTQTKGFSIFQDKVVGANEYFTEIPAAKKEARPQRINDVKGFIAKDDTTFIIKLTKPFAPFLKTLTSAFCYIVPEEAVKCTGDNFRMNPVGTGPFIFSEFKEGQYLFLKRNPHYWQKDNHGNRLPFLDEIKITFIRDLTTQLMELGKGTLSECYRIPEELRADWIGKDGKLSEKYQKDFILQRIPALSVQYYGMNTKVAPFNDKRVRQALCYAIDRDKIAKYVLKGGVAAPATHGLIPPSIPGYNAGKTHGYGFDPAKARQLMAEAGYPNGKGFPAVSLQLNSGGGRNVQVAEAIQAMLKETLNINIALTVVEWSQHLESLERSKAPFFRIGWVADYPEPENFLNLLYGNLVPKNLDARSYPNTTRFENSEFDALYKKALATINDHERYDLYQKAEQIAMNEAPMMLIFYDLDERILNRDVRDYPLNAMDRRDMKFVWLSRLDSEEKNTAQVETKAK
ncbi:MAG: ABC transporter substrate-binding protein [Chlorobiales bacterium]|nr:ABC transporter substrate-binding protein [Chlorobiales bacterium]